MELRQAPAAVPAAFFLLGIAAASWSEREPVALLVLLVALSAGGHGRASRSLLALALGCLIGIGATTATPSDDRDLAAEIQGTVCSHWREAPAFASRSAHLCPDWLRQGPRLLSRPPRIWIDLPAEVDRPPPPGSTVRARGTLGRSPGFANAQSVEPGPWRVRVKSRRLISTVRPPGAIWRWAGNARQRIEGRLRAAERGPGRGVALVRAFVLGDDAKLTENQRRSLRRAGLAHLLAVSGFHVTIVGLAAALLVGWARRPIRRTIPLLAIAVYLAAVGPDPSVLRASSMSAAGWLAMTSRRTGSALQALSWTAVVLVAIDPGAVHDIGFQLSFGATLALVLFVERWSDRLVPRLGRVVGGGLAASLAALAGSLPGSVAAFAQATPAAPLWNLLAVPWAGLWLLIGLGWTVLAFAAPAAASTLAPLLDLGVAPLDWLERLPARATGSYWLPGGVLSGLIASGTLILSLELRRRRAAVGLAVAALLAAPGPPPPPAVAEVAFLDVGQGDATLIRFEGWTMLVDGGGQPGRDLGTAVLRPALAARGVTRLDVAVLSHPDTDHCLGLLDLAAVMPIREVWLAAEARHAACARQLLQGRGRRSRPLGAGDRLRLGGIEIVVLHPAGVPGDGARRNRDSLVLRVELAGRTVLLPGDLPGDLEELLASSRPEELNADLLKAAHHGSETSSRAAFLAAVAPASVVVSAGARNAFGHPDERALRRLRESGATVWRVDRSGEVRFRWRRGEPWRISLPASPRRVRPQR